MKATNTREQVIEWRLGKRSPIQGATAWTSTTGCFALVSRDPCGWHVSVSHPKREPSWDEMRTAREEMTPDEVTMAMVLPPRSEYVNVHETCLHLFQIDGEVAP